MPRKISEGYARYLYNQTQLWNNAPALAEKLYGEKTALGIEAAHNRDILIDESNRDLKGADSIHAFYYALSSALIREEASNKAFRGRASKTIDNIVKMQDVMAFMDSDLHKLGSSYLEECEKAQQLLTPKQLDSILPDRHAPGSHAYDYTEKKGIAVVVTGKKGKQKVWFYHPALAAKSISVTKNGRYPDKSLRFKVYAETSTHGKYVDFEDEIEEEIQTSFAEVGITDIKDYSIVRTENKKFPKYLLRRLGIALIAQNEVTPIEYIDKALERPVQILSIRTAERQEPLETIR